VIFLAAVAFACPLTISGSFCVMNLFVAPWSLCSYCGCYKT